MPTAAGAHTVHPPSDSVSTVEPPTSHSHILALAGYSTTRAGFHESLRRRQTLGRQATAFPRLQESRPSTRLGQECSHSGPARPSRLPPAAAGAGKTSAHGKESCGVPELHSAGQAAGKHVAKDLSGLSGLSRRLRAGWEGSCELQAQGSPAAQRQQGLDAVAP